ncbi:MAG: sulfotransferase domain-containing protein [Cytophagaceae bacterium]|nr:sulfotransferase domain-containing protein [Cytophagaceae bacterium]
MKKVNVLIIGAGRSGTTSLYHYMKDHNDICFSSIKEVHFFSIKDLYKRGEEYYHYFFNNPGKKILASADTYLLVDKKAPKKIFSYNPEMKIVVLLRDPVDRAYSSYQYSINNGYENKNTDFLQTLEHEKEILTKNNIIQINNLCHFYGSLYYTHLRYWMQYF